MLPQICISLRLLLPLPVALGERVLNKLTLIKNIMIQDKRRKVKNLLTISIDHDKCSTISSEEIIEEFSAMKVRRKMF